MPIQAPTTDQKVLANEIATTQHAQGAFYEAVTALTRIVSTVLDSQGQLTTSGMVTSAGAQFGTGCVQWCDDFNNLRSSLQWMGDQLGQTAQQLMAGNQQCNEMASAMTTNLPNFGPSFSYPSG
jgi:hypothetical protein